MILYINVDRFVTLKTIIATYYQYYFKRTSNLISDNTPSPF